MSDGPLDSSRFNNLWMKLPGGPSSQTTEVRDLDEAIGQAALSRERIAEMMEDLQAWIDAVSDAPMEQRPKLMHQVEFRRNALHEYVLPAVALLIEQGRYTLQELTR